MTVRSPLLASAVFALLMGGVFLLPPRQESPAAASSAASAGSTVAALAVPPPSPSRTLAAPAAAGLEVLTAPVSILPSDNAALSEQIALRQLAADQDLALNEQQWAALAAVVAHYQTVRQAYEASIAEVTPRGAGQATVVIPAYPEIGDVLRLKLIAGMEAALGTDTALAVVDQLGAALDGYFAGFGVSTQTLDFAAQSERPNDYLITRTATYWNSVKDQAGLTTRQESHWPDAQDGTASRWQPFFALLAAQGGIPHQS